MTSCDKTRSQEDELRSVKPRLSPQRERGRRRGVNGMLSNRVTQGTGLNPVWASCRGLVVKEMRFINIFLTSARSLSLSFFCIFSLKAALAFPPVIFQSEVYLDLMSLPNVYVVKCPPMINMSFPGLRLWVHLPSHSNR